MPGLGGWVGLDKEISQDAIDSARLKAVRHANALEEKIGVKPEIVTIVDDSAYLTSYATPSVGAAAANDQISRPVAESRATTFP